MPLPHWQIWCNERQKAGEPLPPNDSAGPNEPVGSICSNVSQNLTYIPVDLM